MDIPRDDLDVFVPPRVQHNPQKLEVGDSAFFELGVFLVPDAYHVDVKSIGLIRTINPLYDVVRRILAPIIR